MSYYGGSNEVRADRIRPIHVACGSRSSSPAQRYQRARGERAQAGRCESEQARTKAETKSQDFRFGPRFKVLVAGRFSHLAGDFGPSETFANDLPYSQIESVTVSQIFAMVEAESLFVQITEQVERFDRNVGSVDTSLQETPEVFESVGVNVPFRVLLRVVDYFVGILQTKPTVGIESVGEHFRPWRYFLANLRLKDAFLGALHDAKPYFAAVSFEQSHNGNLSGVAGSGDSALAVLVHIPSFAADESLIHFDFARELAAVLTLQGKPDALKHKPARLLSDSSSAGNLVGTHAVFAVGKHPHGEKPFIQSDRRILKDSPDFDRKLSLGVPSLALPYAPGSHKGDVLGAAGGASHSVFPPTCYEVANTVIGAGEVDNRFLKGEWFDHESIMPENA